MTGRAGTHAYFFHQGTDCRAYEYLGAHMTSRARQKGVLFRVGAPEAQSVCVMGEFNDWNKTSHPMKKVTVGVWELFVPGVKEYCAYKFAVTGCDGVLRDKCDPYAFHSETRPFTASRVYDPSKSYKWHDKAWLAARSQCQNKPVSIYEVHLGSWRHDENDNPYTYRRLADELIPYALEMGFTHIELLPVMEHPLDASWGYQCTGYFSPTSRFGEPRDLQEMIDGCHQAGLGVILDWVPAHFPKDGFFLSYFDGTPLYEGKDVLRRERPDWGTYMFDFGRNEVRSFLLSSAMFWLDMYHADGFRIDAVASMLYLDFGKEHGQWTPNIHGSNENLEAISFLRKLNETVFEHYPTVLMMAEESSAWPMVTKPVWLGGLGFNYKWNMGWMNDVLDYSKVDPIFRQYNHNKLTFSLTYAFNESYVLPFSHDEVVHLKKALIEKFPGDEYARMANLRALLAYMFAHPGKKLLFMGGEFGQHHEWDEKTQLEWHLLDEPVHRQLQDFTRELNRFYQNTPALWENDIDWKGFQWIACDNYAQNILVFRRIDHSGNEIAVTVNFAPVMREHYRIGLPFPCTMTQIFSTDEARFGGWDIANPPIHTDEIPWNGLPVSAELTIPPMSVVFLQLTPDELPDAELPIADEESADAPVNPDTELKDTDTAL